MAFTLKSSAFQAGEQIPAVYTCDGKNISPPLHWEDMPQNTQSLVLILDDPDAPSGTWDHWILFNIPAESNSLTENLQTLPAGAQMGKNSWNHTNYGGPCPPKGSHRYVFTLYALDTRLDLKTGQTKQNLFDAMQGHIISQTKLIGHYQR